jgi:hypothetical protein
LPRGCIYSHKGPALFFSGDQEEDQLYFLGLMNSRVYADLLALQVGFGSYDVGVIQKTPVAWPIDSMEKVEIGGLALRAHALARQGDSTDETAHGFVLAALARPEMSVSEAQTKVIDERIALTSEGSAVLAQIDRYVAALYGLSEQETALLGTLDTAAIGTSNGVEDLVDDEELKEQADVPDLLMWCFGCALGRWDVRFALDPSRVPRAAQPFDPLPRCAPGALTGLNCLPAYANDILDTYPLRIDWDGILVDDQEHVDDITRRIRDVLAVIWNERAAAIEGEVCEALSVRTLADYIRRPAGFFGHHLQRYSKSRRQAPIYWPFSTASGSYTLWLYYHRLTSDTLYTGVNKYVAPKIEDVQRGLAEVERQLAAASGGAATKLRDQREKQQAFLNELEAFRTELLRVAGLPYRPNLDDGVIINAAPLWKLFRLPKWQKATRETWEKLERGDYDWAHLAYRIWPERVREKCRTDKSLAIAHGLEELYSAPAAEATRGRGKGRKPAALIEDDE